MQTVKHDSELGDDPVIVMNKWYLIVSADKLDRLLAFNYVNV